MDENSASDHCDQDQSRRSGWAGESDARRTVQALIEAGAVVELRAIGVAGVRGKGIVSGYFDNPDLLIAEARKLDGRAKGIYITLNTINPALLARSANRVIPAVERATSDGEVIARRWLLIDADPVRPSGVSSTDEEKKLAYAVLYEVYLYLQELGFPEPLKADSGNGGHMVYAIDLPADDDGLVQRVLDALAFRFNTAGVVIDQSVHKRAQLTKLYGTLVMKGDATADRPHRRSRVFSVPERLEVVARELLEVVAAQAPPRKGQPAASTGGGASFDVDLYLREHGLTVARTGPWNGGSKWILAVCPFDAEHTDLAAFVVRFPDGAVAAGCHHNSCQGKQWHDLRDRVEPGWRDRAAPPRPKSQSTRSARCRTKALPYVDFPVHALPEPLRSFVVSGSQSIGCDASLLALPLLMAVGAAIGNTRRIRLKRSWTEPSIFWGAGVAESGDRKSPAFEIALKHVYAQQQLALDNHHAQAAAFERAEAEYERELHLWKKTKAESAGPVPMRPKAPVAERYVVSDVTMEALAVRLAEQPRGLLAAYDELGVWFGSFDSYSRSRGRDVSHWLSIHGARAIFVDRKGSPNVVHVPHASVSIIGTIQPRTLRRALGAEHFHNGLAARLLLVNPPRRKRKWNDADIDEVFELAVSMVFKKLFDVKLDVDADGRPTPKILDLNPSAKALWVKFYDQHGEEQYELAGDLAAAWSKLEAYAARFALVIHMVRWAEGDPTVGERIDEQSMDAAITLARWFGSEARRVYAMIESSDEDYELDQLAERIVRRGGRVRPRDWRRMRNHVTTTAARAELQMLVDAGLGKWETVKPGPRGGRPTEEFALHPQEPDEEVDDETSAAGERNGPPSTADGVSSVLDSSVASNPESEGSRSSSPESTADEVSSATDETDETSSNARSDSQHSCVTDESKTDETPLPAPPGPVPKEGPQVSSDDPSLDCSPDARGEALDL